jgi:hypothetical protein
VLISTKQTLDLDGPTRLNARNLTPPKEHRKNLTGAV